LAKILLKRKGLLRVLPNKLKNAKMELFVV